MEEQNNIQKLTCPECGKQYRSLSGHMKIHGIYNDEEFRKKYPDYKGPLHIDSRKRGEYVCPECGKVYNLPNGLSIHIKYEHPEIFESKYDKDNRTCANLICPICHKNYSDIKQHINMNHRMEWEEFCKEYDWDITLTKCITDEYRKHLSENKKKFYNSDRGGELKAIQSEKWSKDNPARDRDNIAKAIYNRTLNGGIPTENYRGIKVKYKDKTFRSFNEFTFYAICISNGIFPQYESKEYVVRYLNEQKHFVTTYLPDFYIENYGLIELKSSKFDKERSLKDQGEKLTKVAKIYASKGITFKVLELLEAFEELGICMKQYEIKDFMKKFVLDNIEDIHITCRNNSDTIHDIFGLDLSNNEHITLIKFW